MTALLKGSVSSSKKFQCLRNMVVCTHTHSHAKPPFLRDGYFRVDCLAKICFKIFESFSYYSFFNKFNPTPLLSLFLRFLSPPCEFD